MVTLYTLTLVWVRPAIITVNEWLLERRTSWRRTSSDTTGARSTTPMWPSARPPPARADPTSCTHTALADMTSTTRWVNAAVPLVVKVPTLKLTYLMFKGSSLIMFTLWVYNPILPWLKRLTILLALTNYWEFLVHVKKKLQWRISNGFWSIVLIFQRFSPCSLRSIRKVLQAKSGRCFSEPEESFCGNLRVEGGEECDAGLLGN